MNNELQKTKKQSLKLYQIMNIILPSLILLSSIVMLITIELYVYSQASNYFVFLILPLVIMVFAILSATLKNTSTKQAMSIVTIVLSLIGSIILIGFILGEAYHYVVEYYRYHNVSFYKVLGQTHTALVAITCIVIGLSGIALIVFNSIYLAKLSKIKAQKLRENKQLTPPQTQTQKVTTFSQKVTKLDSLLEANAISKEEYNAVYKKLLIQENELLLPKEDKLTRDIKKLKQLLSDGVLTQEEYSTLFQQLVSK